MQNLTEKVGIKSTVWRHFFYTVFAQHNPQSQACILSILLSPCFYGTGQNRH